MNPTDKKIAKEFAKRLKGVLGDTLIKVILFGSRARGDARDGSDFDVIVIVSERTPSVRERVLDIEVEMMDRYETLFAAVIYDQKEWSWTSDSPLGWNVSREGIQL